MKSRGRESTASLAVVQLVRPVERMERPKPPSELTDEQADEWRAVVERLPAEWFPRETHGLLTQYCRHVVAARRLSQLIEQAETCDPVDVEGYDRLLKMQEREGRAMSSLATRMRLSQQTTYDKSKKKPSTTRKPWD